MIITAEITKVIAEALKNLGVKRPQVMLEHPTDLSHGDYSTNVALVYAKKLNLSPLEVARAIVAAFNQQKLSGLERVEIAGFGFINFYLSASFFAQEIEKIIVQGDQYGTNDNLKNQKVIVEYTDPNLFKEFHIGHLVPNIIGESISRLVEYQGATVRRFCYHGDVGLHVAKAIWGIKSKSLEFWKVKFLGSDQQKAKFLGRVYAHAAKLYESDEVVKQQIISLNKEIYTRSNSKINYYYDTGWKWSLKYLESIYKTLGTTFDALFFESKTANVGLELVHEFLAKGLFKESDGAVVFPGEDYDLHTRVFINSNGLPTYETKELGLAKLKYEEFPYDRSIIVVANEQSSYFQVLLKVIDLVFPHLAGRTTHIPNGLLRLPSGKMSSRTGDVIAALSVINDVKQLIIPKIKNDSIGLNKKETLATSIAIGAIKFSILRQAAGKDIIFDFDKSLSFEGDSGPYLQYSYTRAKSLLEKAATVNLKSDSTTKTDKEVILLEKLLYRFPEIVARAGQEYAPHYVVTYLLELSSSFNSFYAGAKIIDLEDPESSYRLALTESFATVMKNGLYLLGIESPEKM